MRRNGPGAGVRGFVRVALLLATVAVAASTIFLGCDQPAGPVVEPPPTEPPPAVDHEHLASGAAFEAFLRDGTQDAFTERAVDVVLAAIPADELPAFVAELEEIDLNGDMIELVTNYSFRQLMRIIGPLWDAEYGSEQARLQSSSAAVGGSLADEDDDPPDPIDELIEEIQALLRSWIDWAEGVKDHVIDRVFNTPQGRVSLLTACHPLRVVVSKTKCLLTVAAYVGWNHLGNAPPITNPELIDRLPSGTGERWIDVTNKAAPCDVQVPGQPCKWVPLKLKPFFERGVKNSFLRRVDNTRFEVNKHVRLELPEAKSGDRPLKYRLAPEIPGLSFVGNLSQQAVLIVGTPEPGARGVYQMTYRVTDADGDTDEFLFTILVNPPGGPPPPAPLAFPVSELPRQSYVVGTPIESVTFPAATGGVLPIRYTCRILIEGGRDKAPGLGLRFHGPTLSGTPVEEGMGEAWCLATDAEGSTASLGMSFTVTAAVPPVQPLEFVGVIRDQDYVVDTPGGVLPLPKARGGTPPLEYAMSGTPYPSGLSITYDEGSGNYFLEGTPTKVGEYRMTWRVTDAEGLQAELSFTVRVTAAVPAADPLEFVGVIRDQDYVVGADVRITLPEARGGTAPLTYKVFSTPPSPWLKWNSASRVLWGTPAEAGEYRLRYQVTDANGQQAELRFTVTVTSEPPPGSEPLAFVDSIADQHDYAVGADVRIALPEARGGTPPLTYKVFSTPPSPWLKWNSASRVLSGTPAEAAEYRLRYQVTDANGEQAELRFTVTVTERTDSARFIAVGWESHKLRQLYSRECRQRVWVTVRGRYWDVVIDEADRKCAEKIPGGDGHVFDCTVDIAGSAGSPFDRCVAYASASSWRTDSNEALCVGRAWSGDTIGEARNRAIEACETSPGAVGCSVKFSDCAGSRPSHASAES